MTIKQYLSEKPINYVKIDYGRMPRIYQKYAKHFKLKKVIHVIGTNGKGTTGRWIALMLKKAGFLVGHFTSPHILEYNERFWFDGKILEYSKLNKLHVKLTALMKKEDLQALSYFEYSTFIAALAFEACDFVVLEAGLGGEYDATNVFKKTLSVITTIGYDHTDFLGNTLVEIATTKVNSIQTDALISYDNEKEVINVAKKIAMDKKVNLHVIKKDENKNELIAYMEKNNYPAFLLSNLQNAFTCIKKLRVSLDVLDIPRLDLKGRCEKIAPNITIDVGHNPLSAKVVAKNFKPKSVNLIYNSFKDKDIKKILDILFPITKKVYILPLHVEKREMGEDEIISYLKSSRVEFERFDFTIKSDEEYLVFGSFHVAEAFLRRVYAK